ncbi:WXG100-like domain-containing protein [Nocardia aurantia]|uniref:Outer membrane channel protein CpnT-like N-terminal domain-containing protein n=1 Tax=Nocardia aurantia TaxID=2585199 RepID=A0A7K0DR29_9NOCA|nr:hypothetical protein [Nocardia aurantia]MQY28235.1 hypothetical protein [Nocardia aurantia]
MPIEIPHDVALFLNYMGVPYPDINEDDVRRLGREVENFATNVSNTHSQATGAIKDMNSVYSGYSYEQMLAAWGRMSAGHMRDLDTACKAVGRALDIAAEVITVAKVAVLGELAALAASYFATLSATFATGGLSAAIALAIQDAAKRILFALEQYLVAYLLMEVVEKAIEPLEHVVEEMVGGALHHAVEDLLGLPPPSSSTAMPLHIEPDEVLRYAALLDKYADDMLKHANDFANTVGGMDFSTPTTGGDPPADPVTGSVQPSPAPAQPAESAPAAAGPAVPQSSSVSHPADPHSATAPAGTTGPADSAAPATHSAPGQAPGDSGPHGAATADHGRHGTATADHGVGAPGAAAAPATHSLAVPHPADAGSSIPDSAADRHSAEPGDTGAVRPWTGEHAAPAPATTAGPNAESTAAQHVPSHAGEPAVASAGAHESTAAGAGSGPADEAAARDAGAAAPAEQQPAGGSPPRGGVPRGRVGPWRGPRRTGPAPAPEPAPEPVEEAGPAPGRAGVAADGRRSGTPWSKPRRAEPVPATDAQRQVFAPETTDRAPKSGEPVVGPPRSDEIGATPSADVGDADAAAPQHPPSSAGPNSIESAPDRR